MQGSESDDDDTGYIDVGGDGGDDSGKRQSNALEPFGANTFKRARLSFENDASRVPPREAAPIAPPGAHPQTSPQLQPLQHGIPESSQVLAQLPPPPSSSIPLETSQQQLQPTEDILHHDHAQAQATAHGLPQQPPPQSVTMSQLSQPMVLPQQQSVALPQYSQPLPMQQEDQQPEQSPAPMIFPQTSLQQHSQQTQHLQPTHSVTAVAASSTLAL